MFRFVCAFSRALGGPFNPGVSGPAIGVNGDIVDAAGVVGAEAVSTGTRFERTRIGGFFGGSLRSIAVAGLAGGGGPGEGPCWTLELAVPGDVVCDRGGGGGGDGFAASAPAYDGKS